MSKNCIFCSVNQGVVPAKTLYKDDLVHVFLDVNPVSKGHVLIIPVTHYENIFITPDDVLSRIATVSKTFAIKLQKRLKANGVNILNASGESAQQSVFHLHYHIVPRFQGDNKDLWFHQEAKDGMDLEDVFKLLQ